MLLRPALVPFATFIAVVLTGCCGSSVAELHNYGDTSLLLTDTAEALDRCRDRHGSYPVSKGSEFSPEALGLEDCMASMPVDAWNRPLRYLSSGSSYLLWSTGGDGASDSDPSGGPQDDFGSDVIVFNGEMWQWLEGTSRLREVENDPFGQVRVEISQIDDDAS